MSGGKRREENKCRCMYNVRVQCYNSVFNKAFELEERLSDEEIGILPFIVRNFVFSKPF